MQRDANRTHTNTYEHPYGIAFGRAPIFACFLFRFLLISIYNAHTYTVTHICSIVARFCLLLATVEVVVPLKWIKLKCNLDCFTNFLECTLFWRVGQRTKDMATLAINHTHTHTHTCTWKVLLAATFSIYSNNCRTRRYLQWLKETTTTTTILHVYSPNLVEHLKNTRHTSVFIAPTHFTAAPTLVASMAAKMLQHSCNSVWGKVASSAASMSSW